MRRRYYFILKPDEPISTATDFYNKDLQNLKDKKELTGKDFFKDKVRTASGAESVFLDETAKIETRFISDIVDYVDFLLIKVFLEYLKSPNKFDTDQLKYFLSFIDEKSNILDLNESQFNALFEISGEGIWKVLNNNPGGFWYNLNEDIKTKISYLYGMQSLIYNYIHIKDIYESFSEYEFYYPQPQYKSAGILIDREDGYYYIASKDVFDRGSYKLDYFLRNYEDIKIKSDRNFVKLINSNLFFTPSQVRGIEKVSEGTKEHLLTKDNWDKLVSLAKEDELFNIFDSSLIEGKNNNSSIGKYLKNLITGSEDYSAGFIIGAPTLVDIIPRIVGEGGTITATDAEIEEFARDGDSDFNSNISQCLLITDLANIGKHRKKLRADSKAGVKSKDPNTWSYPYGGRIYCLDIDQDKSFLNCLNVPNGMNEFIKHTTKNDFNNHFKYDFSLYKIVEEDGRVLEYPYLFESDKDDRGNVPSAVGFNFENRRGYTEEDIIKQVFVKTDVKNTDRQESKKIQISNVEISIEGDTPATVKSNIDVKITLTVPSLDAIQAVFQAEIKDPDKPDKPDNYIEYQYSLVELLSYNIGQKYDGTQAARALTTSYIPNKNRLVMKISPKVIKPTGITNDEGYFSQFFYDNYVKRRNKILKYAKNSELILDLTLVNYSVDRSFNNQKDDTITIEYKGFTKSFLNEPFCDILLDNDTKKELADIEKATIDELSSDPKYCDLKNIRKRISKHFEDMRAKKDENEGQNDTILKKLSRNDQIYTLNLKSEIIGALSNNVDKKTKKILKPKEVHKLVSSGEAITKLEGNYKAVSNVIDSPNTINFFYFGDLIDACMDFIYKGPKWYNASTKVKRKLDRLRDDDGNVLPDIRGKTISEIRQKFANFPLKIILPTFFPTVYDPLSDSFDTSTDALDKISIADIPIAVSYFQRWYEEEITNKKVKTYPLASFISRILNSIVNNVLSDNCYNIGNIQRRYFNIRSDFGTFTGKNNVEFNEKFFNQNYTNFDVLFNEYKGPFAKLEIDESPYLKKSTKIPRAKHCNYLVVYEQHSSLEPIESIDASYKPFSDGTFARINLEDDNVPEFSPNRIEPFSRKETDFTKNMTFSKTQLPKAAEVRFYNDGFNELSALAAVHDVSMETSFLTTMYPGVLCWIDPDFIDGPDVYGSIPWTVGIGGFHLTTKVVHSFDVNAGRIKEASTKIDAKFVDSGAGGSQVKFVECVIGAYDREQSFPNNDAEEVE